MFDFEKLTVYHKAIAFHKEIVHWLRSNPLQPHQLFMIPICIHRHKRVGDAHIRI